MDPAGAVLFDHLVKPTVKIAPKAQSVHHISELMLSDKPRFPFIYDDLYKILHFRKVITYNADFDVRLLTQTCNRYSLPYFDTSWSCAMIQYSNFCGDWNEDRGNFKFQALPSSKHTAAADCLATLEVIKIMAAAVIE